MIWNICKMRTSAWRGERYHMLLPTKFGFHNGIFERDLPLASGESATRYYSTKQFLCSGVPHVYLPQSSTPCQPFNGPPRVDYRFLDNFSVPINNTWYVYTDQPLRESLARYVKFPIATNFDRNQPRLLLVSVDVQEGSSSVNLTSPK